MSVQFQVGAKNPELQKIIDLIPSIYHRGEKAVVKELIDPAKLLPGMCRQMSIILPECCFSTRVENFIVFHSMQNVHMHSWRLTFS